MEPLDLTKHPPRGPRVKLGGLIFLARSIDKLRAELPGGNPSRYLVRAGQSPIFLSRLGIEVNELADVVRDAKSEEDVVRWVHEHSDPSKYDEINQAFLMRTQDDIPPERRGTFESNYSEELRGKHHNLFDLLEADDRELFAGN